MSVRRRNPVAAGRVSLRLHEAPYGTDSTVAIAVAATALTGGDDGSGYAAEGVLLYDVDVTHGDAPGAMIVWGFIDKSKLDEDPCDDAVEALKGRIVFFDV